MQTTLLVNMVFKGRPWVMTTRDTVVLKLWGEGHPGVVHRATAGAEHLCSVDGVFKVEPLFH